MERIKLKSAAIGVIFFALLLSLALAGSSCTGSSKGEITAEMACEGVRNYCHLTYDWSMAEENPSLMYVEMGEETDSAYQVVFRSYTGTFVNFYVNKASGKTRMVEYVPMLNIKEDAGTIDLFDYLSLDVPRTTGENAVKQGDCARP